ncbi:uronate isomerase [Klebsiella pneumoniae]|uniref:Uronate isomerase n=1 Tax=Klebsiella pneumoniae TaxID=573 RepID=A0A377U5Q9_KLEPN|nr:uronate isomerase [Klebsiella pneumoniae]
MTSFMTEDFLLDTEFARRLYHDYAKDQPISTTTATFRRSRLPKTIALKPV